MMAMCVLAQATDRKELENLAKNAKAHFVQQGAKDRLEDLKNGGK